MPHNQNSLVLLNTVLLRRLKIVVHCFVYLRFKDLWPQSVSDYVEDDLVFVDVVNCLCTTSLW